MCHAVELLALVAGAIDTGTSAEAYWNSRASFWETYFDYGRYPTMAAIWEAGGFDDEQAHAFDRQLRRLLDGLEASLG